MKFRSLFSFTATALLFLSCRNGTTFANAQEYQQFGGQIIDPNEFHWFTAIRRRNNGDFICSGSLIGSRYVLTAHHCIENFPSSSIVVEAGYLCRNRTNCLRGHSFVGVRRWYQHEGGGDMALLVLDESVSIDVKPAVPYLGTSIHPKQSFLKKKKKGRMMEMVGAGRTGPGRGDDISFFVRKLDVKYLSPEDCRSKVGNPSLVTDFVVCSIPADGNPCAGDSGSAVVVPGKQQFAGRDVVMAVHSFGPKNCDDATDQAIGHFRLEDAADLIREVICDEGELPPEDWCPDAPVPLPAPLVMCEIESAEEKSSSRPITSVLGSKLRTMTGHTGGVAIDGLSFSSDGSRLLSASYDGSNKLWDPVVGGAALSTFTGDGSLVYAGEFHPIGKYFASGSREDTVKLWDTKMTEQPFHIFEGHIGWVRSVSWSPCGTILASASTDDTIKVWSTITRQPITTIKGHTGEATSVSFHPEGTQLASGSKDRTIKLWDATNDWFGLVHTLSEHKEWVWSVSYSPDGKFLASGSDDKSAKVWDVKTGAMLHDFREHTGNVRVVAWSPGGRLLATGSDDDTVRLWDGRNGGPSLLVLQHDSDVYGLDWSPDGTLLAAGLDPSGDIVIWRITTEFS